MTNDKPLQLNYKFSDFFYECFSILKPKDDITVSQWADLYRQLDSKTSSEPGKWDTERTPYLRGIMNAFNIVDVEDITLIKATQLGGTEALLNILGYIIGQDPSPTMIIYPTDTLAEYTSKNRIEPLILKSDEIKDCYLKEKSKILELQFKGMYLVLVGANSPSNLSSRPIKFVLIDELDKFPLFTAKEASPLSLIKERQKTFPNTKKTFKLSSPTTKKGPIYKEWEKADKQYKYYVVCPHCGEYQEFKFPQIKWTKNAQSPQDAADTAYYECSHCKGMIKDHHKPEMLRTGEWRTIKDNGHTKKIAFHINAIYSPWLTFGDVAYEFMASKDDPELLMNFVNSWLAEPWEDKDSTLDTDYVYARQSEYDENIIPKDAIILTGGVDVQKDCFYWTIRAWGTRLTSWNISHGKVETWDEIEEIMDTVFTSEDGKTYQVNLYAVDSGDRTDEVYDYIATHSDCAIPVKGSSRPILQKYNISTIEKDGSKAYGMRLYIVDGGQYKDMIAGRLRRKNGTGAWQVFKGIDKDYAEQICSEEKICERKAGRETWVWKKKQTSSQNHYLDCEVYAGLAADVLGVRYLSETDIPQNNGNITPQRQEYEQNSTWIDNNKGNNWLHG